MKRIVLLLLLIAPLAGFGQKIELAGSDLENFHRVDEGLYRSDQPSAADFRALERFGICEVLNLRRFHSDDDEARGTQLLLHRLKTRAGTIDEGELIEALRVIKNRKGPLLIHCWHGSDRTGAVVAMYRIVFQGVDKQEAIRELMEGGYGYHAIYDNIPETIRRIDIDRVKRALEVK